MSDFSVLQYQLNIQVYFGNMRGRDEGCDLKTFFQESFQTFKELLAKNSLKICKQSDYGYPNLIVFVLRKKSVGRARQKTYKYQLTAIFAFYALHFSFKCVQ